MIRVGVELKLRLLDATRRGRDRWLCVFNDGVVVDVGLIMSLWLVVAILIVLLKKRRFFVGIVGASERMAFIIVIRCGRPPRLLGFVLMSVVVVVCGLLDRRARIS